jgi:hypothetical protein
MVLDAGMQSGTTLLRGWLQARRAAPALLGLVWLATALVSVSPELHQRLHADSHNTSHECIVTLLGQGSVLTEHCPIVVSTPLRPVLCGARFTEVPFLPAVSHPLAASRAPPVHAL